MNVYLKVTTGFEASRFPKHLARQYAQYFKSYPIPVAAMAFSMQKKFLSAQSAY